MFTINENCLNKNESDDEIFYKYAGLDKLVKLDNNLNLINIKKIYICGYRINNNG